MEQTLSILLKKHYELLDRYLNEHPLMTLLDERVRKKKAIDALLWLDIQRTIIEIDSLFFNKLRATAPSLTEKEKCLCCLLRLHVSADTMSVLLQLSKASISVYKSKIAKSHFDKQDMSLGVMLLLL